MRVDQELGAIFVEPEKRLINSRRITVTRMYYLPGWNDQRLGNKTKQKWKALGLYYTTNEYHNTSLIF